MVYQLKMVYADDCDDADVFCVLQIRQLPESVIVETTEYKCLQSQFSVLYNESMQLKTQLDDARQQMQTSKNAHLRQIEMMEVRSLYRGFISRVGKLVLIFYWNIFL